MRLKEFNSFYLVGGTALALKFGHRISVDLDLFSNENFDTANIVNVLQKEFSGDFYMENQNPKWGIFCFIEEIKVDIIHYKHPIIHQPDTIEGIRLYSSPDITAMKINAILGRGKKKDFWDLAELLQHYKLAEMISFHNKKYPSQNLLITIPQAITYFDDAEESEDPVSLKNQTWDSVKKTIQKSVREYLS
ncbi:nucleotidyl transferase AbiEii/AbiGii toxin family protein [Parafilimonas sp.]|uniref:nucleotidyl transferase AbiEii/AbiGii toxin family protein n=1 Tax=Parafilimonas sp. TaxID=1969739 RepID=UPI0039E24B07